MPSCRCQQSGGSFLTDHLLDLQVRVHFEDPTPGSHYGNGPRFYVDNLATDHELHVHGDLAVHHLGTYNHTSQAVRDSGSVLSVDDIYDDLKPFNAIAGYSDRTGCGLRQGDNGVQAGLCLNGYDLTSSCANPAVQGAAVSPYINNINNCINDLEHNSVDFIGQALGNVTGPSIACARSPTASLPLQYSGAA